jgi:hypothetical protein
MLSESGFYDRKFDNEGLIKPSPLAIAIETRQQKEREKVPFSTNWLFGDKLPSEFSRKIDFAHNSLMNEIIIRNPSVIEKHSSDLINMLFDNISDENCFLSINLDPDTDPYVKEVMTPKKAKKLWKNSYEYFYELSLFSDQIKDLPGQVEEAKKMGDEFKCTPNEIYLNNNYYNELIRRTSSPQKIIEKGVVNLNLLMLETLEKLLIKSGIMLIDLVASDTDADPLEVEEERKQAIEDVKNSKIFKAVQKRFPRFKQAKARYLIEKVNRFWGEGAFDKLPEELREKVNSIINPTSSS